MEARSLFIIAVLILAALVKASVKNTARRGGKTTRTPIIIPIIKVFLFFIFTPVFK